MVTGSMASLLRVNDGGGTHISFGKKGVPARKKAASKRGGGLQGNSSLRDITNQNSVVDSGSTSGDKKRPSKQDRNSMKRVKKKSMSPGTDSSAHTNSSLHTLGNGTDVVAKKFLITKKSNQPGIGSLSTKSSTNIPKGAFTDNVQNGDYEKPSSLMNLKINQSKVDQAKQYIVQAKGFAKYKDCANIMMAVKLYKKAQVILGCNDKLALKISSLENRLAILGHNGESTSTHVTKQTSLDGRSATNGTDGGVRSHSYAEHEVETAKQYIIQAKQFSKMKDPSSLVVAVNMYRQAQSMLPYNEKLVFKISTLENRLAMMQHEEQADRAEKEANSSRRQGSPEDKRRTSMENNIEERLAEMMHGDDDDEFSFDPTAFIKKKKTTATSEANETKRKSLVLDPLDDLFQVDPLKMIKTDLVALSVVHGSAPEDANEDVDETLKQAELSAEEKELLEHKAFVSYFDGKFQSCAVQILVKVALGMHTPGKHLGLLDVKKKTKFHSFLTFLDEAQSILEKFDNTKQTVGRKVRFCTYDLSTIPTPAPASAFPEKKSSASKLAEGMEALGKILASISLAARKLMIESTKKPGVKKALCDFVSALQNSTPDLNPRETCVAQFYGKAFASFTEDYSPHSWRGPFSDRLSTSLSSILRHHLRCALNKPTAPIRVTCQKLLSDMHDSFLQLIPGSGSLKFNHDDIAAVAHDALKLFAVGQQLKDARVDPAHMLLSASTEEYETSMQIMVSQWEYIEAHKFLKSLLSHRFIRDAYMCNQVHHAVEGAWEALQKFGELTSRFPNECPEEQILVKFCISPDKFYSELCGLDSTIERLEVQLAMLDAVNVSERFSQSKSLAAKNACMSVSRRRSSISRASNVVVGVEKTVAATFRRFRLPEIATDAMQDVDHFLKSKREGKYSRDANVYSQIEPASPTQTSHLISMPLLATETREAPIRPAGPFKCPCCVSGWGKSSIGEILCDGCHQWHHMKCLNLTPAVCAALDTLYCHKCYVERCVIVTSRCSVPRECEDHGIEEEKT